MDKHPHDEPNSIEAQTPLGKFRILGNERGLLVFVFAAAAYFAYMHHEQSREDTRRVVQEVSNLREASMETTYVISLSQAERDKLNIAMPESLRKRTRRSRVDEP